MPELAANPLIQNGDVALDPTPNRDVVHSETALGHDLFQIPLAERISQIPPYTQNDDHGFEVPPTEPRWPLLARRITLPDRLPTIATDPSNLFESHWSNQWLTNFS
jgi:hypothetical protein